MPSFNVKNEKWYSSGKLMSSEKRKIAYIDGKPYEIGSNHTSILKFVRSYVGEKKIPTLCDDPI